MEPVSQVTPRKRKVSAAQTAPITPQSIRRTRGKGAPTPNPPLAPFPTPPATRTRRAPVDPPLAEVINDEETAVPLAKPAAALPAHLQTLLTLHHAFNLALSLHIATKPPILPPHPPSTTRLRLPCLTNFLAIKETVERTGGKRFGVQELARLAWLWNWDGLALPAPPAPAADQDDNPFLVNRSTKREGEDEDDTICAMSYLITPTRTLDSHGKKVGTYGLGIELELKAGETRQLLHNGAEGGLGNKGQGGGMGAVGRWNNAAESRMDAMREKLEAWVKLNGGEDTTTAAAPEEEESSAQALFPTPSYTSTRRSDIPPIPLMRLPTLAQGIRGLMAAANPSSSRSSSSAASPRLTTPRSLNYGESSGSSASSSSRLRPTSLLTESHAQADTDDPFLIDGEAVQAKPKPRPNSLEARRQAMQDRIRQRKEGTQKTLGQSINGGYKVNMAGTTNAARLAELQRLATLSRLESVAETVWMLFSAQTPSSSVLSTPGGTPLSASGGSPSRRRILRTDDVAERVVQSSKTPISHAEADLSLDMLTQLCPWFLVKKVVSRIDYLEMPKDVASTPSHAVSAHIHAPAEAATPNRSARAVTPPPLAQRPALPQSPSPSPRTKRELTGPASPGRVRRAGGLQKVRERIRRELDADPHGVE